MSEKIPSQSTMTDLLGQPLFEVWQKLCEVIDENYEMERLWNAGGKNWIYEYTVERCVEKRSAACTQKTIASGS